MIWIAVAVSAIALTIGLTFWIFAKPLSEKLKFQEAHQNKNSGIMITIIGVVMSIASVIAYFKFQEVGMDAKTDLAAVLTFVTIFLAIGLILSLALSFFNFGKNGKKSRAVISLILAIVFLASIGLLAPHTLLINDDKTTDQYGNTSSDVYRDAISVVNSQLKTPSSAEFSKKSDTTIKLSSTATTWTVSGWVEAKNSFNATVRNNFKVTLVYSGNGVYVVQSCYIN